MLRLGAWLCLACLLTSSAWAQALPWHAAGWARRAVVESPPPQGHDVAAVRVMHGGHASATGQDYRLYDTQGRPVPYQLDFHDPRRDSLLRYRHPGGDGRVLIYFGNASAAVDPMRAVTRDEPGSGPPQPGPSAEGWLPRVGLVLSTHRRDPRADHPRDVPQLAALLKSSPGPDGADYRANIRDGVNLFGDSDHYLSVYRGWLHLPTTGNYGFCTASDEGSFSFLDGQELIHWPGRHTVRWGRHGDVNVQRKLSAGVYYIEYYQEETSDMQMAFLGVRPPGSSRWDMVPPSFWPQPVTAAVKRYETSDGKRGVAITASMIDSVWPSGGPEVQFTRYRLVAHGVAADEPGWTFAWSLGDGVKADGHAVSHIYLSPGDYEVTLTATPAGGAPVQARYPLRVFPVRHVVEPFEAGKLASYLPLVETYDPAALDTRALAGLALLHAETGHGQDARNLAQRALQRGDTKGALLTEAALLAYGDLGGVADGFADTAVPAPQVQAAVAALQRAREQAPSRPRQLQVYAALVRVTGLAGDSVKQAEQHYHEAVGISRQGVATAASQAALREVVIAMGDVRLNHGDIDGAINQYRVAEGLDAAPLPPPVQAAKRGAWQEQIEQHALAKRWAAAGQVAQTWRDTLPSDLAQGPLLWWLGRTALELGNPAAARRPLELAIDAAAGTVLELDCRWYLAEAQGKLGDTAGRRAALEALVQANLGGPRREQAIAELKKLSP